MIKGNKISVTTNNPVTPDQAGFEAMEWETPEFVSFTGPDIPAITSDHQVTDIQRTDNDDGTMTLTGQIEWMGKGRELILHFCTYGIKSRAPRGMRPYT